ncbi:MAG: BamA/TamA family outer membrane protein [Synechococcus sp. SB0668_bin_15]|nr:BamA/TamA family outer membrane protein [Synechococcus sp. SB0668_bin_15]MYC49570.1 BamA/TamA family outer membrane protein [Synechococcus sp. SB0662_bin_14]
MTRVTPCPSSMFNPMVLWSSVMSCSLPRRAPILLATLSATGLFGMALPTPSFAQARWPAQLRPPALGDAAVSGQPVQVPDNLNLAQSVPEEGEATDPSVATQEESRNDPGREQILPQEAPSGAVQDIAPEQQVLIAEVVIVGLEDHPERDRLETVAYDAMEVRPGGSTTRSQLERDLTAIYATGWFSDVRVSPTDSPLGVRLEVTVTPNPVLSAVELEEQNVLLPEEVLQNTFAEDQGQTINLVALQDRLTRLEEWYAEQGYSLARVLGPTRITPEGVIVLTVREGRVADIEIAFTDDSGETTDEDGEPIRGGTKNWVITRELSTTSGDRFNRRTLQQDLERLYGTGLFSDINVSLRPIPSDPGLVDLVLKVQEAKTGSLSGGLGYSDVQGIFGQISFSEDNLLGRAWRTTSQITYGQYGVLLDLAFHDPWIKGDPYRTAFRMNVFLSREIPLQFRSDEGDDIAVVEHYHRAPASTTNRVFLTNDVNNPEVSTELGRRPDREIHNLYQTDDDSVRLQRNGANFQFVRPLNGGNPHADDTRWTASAGLALQEVTIQNADGDAKAYAKGPAKDQETTDNFFCVGHDCESKNILAGLRLGILYNTLNDKVNPTSGNFASFSTEQYISIGKGSPTFNRSQVSFAHFIPVNLLKIYRGCRPGDGEEEDCPQTLAFQVTGGALLGNAPPYESFCLGGSTSIRGFSECAIGPGTTFGEASIEYRFPIFGIVSGALFTDAGSVLGSQSNVTGNPGALLDKPDSGFSYGAGAVLNTPLGPLRLEAAKGNHKDDWGFNFGVGWKF